MTFWSDKNKQDIELLYEQLRKMASRMNQRDDDFKGIKETIEIIQRSIGDIQRSSDAKSLEDIRSRLEKMELWRGEIHRLLTAESKGTGRPKLTPTGHFLRKSF